MTAEERIAAGDGAGAIAILEAEARERPGDAVARLGLFAIRAIEGDSAGAASALDAMEGLGPAGGTARWRALLSAEGERARVVGLEAFPGTIGEAGAATEATWRAWCHLGRGEPGMAREILEEYEAVRFPRRGRLGDRAFGRFLDADDATSPILEVFASDGYAWVGWDQVRSLDVQPPRTLLDAFWVPARLALASGMVGAVVLPGFYPGTAGHPDGSVRLGLRNDWIDLGAGLSRGAGRKLYDVGGEPKGLVELVDLEFDPPGVIEPGTEASR